MKIKKWWIYILILFSAILLYWHCLPQPLFNVPTSTTLYSQNHNLLGARIADDGQWRFPAQDSVPYKFEQSIIHFEDEYFYYHPGFNPFSIARALWQNIKSGKIISGSSTISMQTIRLATNKKRTIWNKLLETIQATRLEIKYNKTEILKLYSSNAPFGGNVVGLDAAAWRYYGRPAHQLSWSESALLAVLPNAPSLIHPGKNRAQLLKKRNRLLQKLLLKNCLDSSNYYLACAEPLPDEPLPLPQLTPHLLSQHFLNNKGERLNTTIDRDLQITCNHIVDKFHQIYRHNEIHNIALLAVNNSTKEIVAYVGNSRSQSGEHGHDVDIIRSARSTGSILKPFLYAASLDDGILLPHMLQADIPTYYVNFAPKNYTEQFDGAVPAHTALSRSLNVPAVRLLDEYRVERFHQLLPKLGINTIKNASSHYGLSLILGGAEANLFELTSAYASMSKSLCFYTDNEAQYEPSGYKSITYSPAKSGTINSQTLSSVLSAGAIYHTFEALTNVQRPEEETGWEYFSSGRKIAWKTGTSFGHRDAWAIGTTPEYTVGVWVGNASGEGRPAIIGGTAAAPIMFEVFQQLPPTSWFEIPYDDLVPTEICLASGYKASIKCTAIDTMYVPATQNDQPVCPYHKLIHLSEDKKYRVNASCYPPAKIIHESWLILPPVMAWHYQSKHPSYKRVPPFHANCSPQDETPLEIIYPKQHSVLVVPKEINGELGRIICRASHRNRSETLFWQLNNTYLGSTRHMHQMAIMPNEGKHIISVSDESGNTVVREFTIPSI